MSRIAWRYLTVIPVKSLSYRFTEDEDASQKDSAEMLHRRSIKTAKTMNDRWYIDRNQGILWHPFRAALVMMVATFHYVALSFSKVFECNGDNVNPMPRRRDKKGCLSMEGSSAGTWSKAIKMSSSRSRPKSYKKKQEATEQCCEKTRMLVEF